MAAAGTEHPSERWWWRPERPGQPARAWRRRTGAGRLVVRRSPVVEFGRPWPVGAASPTCRRRRSLRSLALGAGGQGDEVYAAALDTVKIQGGVDRVVDIAAPRQRRETESGGGDDHRLREMTGLQ